MAEIEKSVELLISSIEEESAREEKRLSDTAKLQRKEKLSDIKVRIKEKSQQQAKEAINECAARANKACAELSESYKARLQSLRKSTAEAVLDETKRLLSEFALSDDYAGYLAKSANKLCAYSDCPCVLLCREADLSAVSEIAKMHKNTGVKSDDSINLGGLKAEFPTSGVTLDDTLGASFEDKTRDFIRKCGLDF